MKQKDIALILVIVFISAVVSLFVSKAIFNSPQKSQQQVVVVPTISSQFTPPDPKYFNDNTYDPTQLITIDANSNQNPFNASQ